MIVSAANQHFVTGCFTDDTSISRAATSFNPLEFLIVCSSRHQRKSFPRLSGIETAVWVFVDDFHFLLVTANVDELNRFETFVIVSDRNTTELHFR